MEEKERKQIMDHGIWRLKTMMNVIFLLCRLQRFLLSKPNIHFSFQLLGKSRGCVNLLGKLSACYIYEVFNFLGIKHTNFV